MANSFRRGYFSAAACMSTVEMLQYGNVEAFLRIVNHADSETQSMVRVTPGQYSRYRYSTDNG